MVHRLTRKLVLAFVAAMLLVTAVPSWASLVFAYVQQPDYMNLYASQNDTSGLFGQYAQAYDNFTLGAKTNILAVEWAGGYFDPQSQGSITGWTVGFYANNGGQPGALVSSYSFAGNGNESSVGVDQLGNPVYFYTEFLNFTANKGTTYWLSVVPNVAFPPQWGWMTSSMGDGVAWQNYFGNGLQVQSDLAFALYTTPEPGSLLLMGTGIVGLAATLRRKLGA